MEYALTHEKCNGSFYLIAQPPKHFAPMNRSRIKFRLLLCLVGNVALLLILALYLQISLETVTRFASLAHISETNLSTLRMVPNYISTITAQLQAYRLTNDRVFVDEIAQSQQLLRQTLVSSQIPSDEFEKTRVNLINQWLGDVVNPVLKATPGSALDWPNLDYRSAQLIRQISRATDLEVALQTSLIDGLSNQENAEIAERVHLMWFLVGSVTIFTIIIQWVISNSIIDPLQQLEHVVKQILAGDHTIKARVHTNDEIQTLAEAFNELTRNLLSKGEELEQSNQLLEARVRDKTAELAEKNERLEEASRLKDEFLATLSHELRTPLTPIISSAHLILSDDGLSPDVHNMMSSVERNAKALSRMIDELLDLSASMNRKLSLSLEPVNMVAWAEDTLNALKPTVESKSLTLIRSLPTHLVSLSVDPSRLSQILTNLVNNAVKFSQKSKSIWVSMFVENGFLVLTVRDEGVGFEQVDIDRIFTMFQQAQSNEAIKAGGLGVGLTVARSLAELHGGSLTAHSPGPSQGATFTLRLPYATALQQAQVTHRPLSKIPLPENSRSLLKGKRILLVEDSTDTLDSLRKIFERRGCIVSCTVSAEEALVLCQKTKPFDLVVSDIGLPGISGVEFISKLRTFPGSSNLIAVALSGLGREKDTAASLRSGFDAHLLKPIDVLRLEQVLADLLQSKPSIQA